MCMCMCVCVSGKFTSLAKRKMCNAAYTDTGMEVCVHVYLVQNSSIFSDIIPHIV